VVQKVGWLFGVGVVGEGGDEGSRGGGVFLALGFGVQRVGSSVVR